MVKTYEIPAGTLTPNGFLEYYIFVRRQGGASLAYSFEIAVNSTNNPATAITIGNGIAGNFEPFSPIKGWHTLKNNLILNPYFTGATNLGPEYRFTTAPLNNTVNSVWFFVFVTPAREDQLINIEGVEILN